MIESAAGRAIGAIVAGGLLTLAFPPYEVLPAAVAGPALLLVVARRAPHWRAAVWSGLLFGAAFMGTLMWWLVNLQWEALAALVVSQVAFFGGFTAVVYGLRRFGHGAWIVGVSGAWAAMEFTRARLPVGGVEWGALGYSVSEMPWLRDAAAWIGVSGWGVVIIALAASVSPWRDWRLPALVGSAVTALVLAAAAFVAGPTGPELRVAIVQGNSPCPEHCLGEREAIFASHLELTRTLPPGELDLVVWAESATTFDPATESEQAKLIAEEARRLQASFLVGGDRPDTEASFVNSNIVFDPDGAIIAEIRKLHPVPFGEYVPLRPILGRLAITSQVPRDMVRGEGPVLAQVGGVAVGSVISFDASFARYSRDSVGAGADVLIVASNEASYGVSPASDQFIAMTSMRSAELGVDVVHAAITGSSALITEGGEVGPRSDLYEAAIVEGTVRVRTGSNTLYTRWGDWLAVGMMATAAALVVAFSLRAVRPGQSKSLSTAT